MYNPKDSEGTYKVLVEFNWFGKLCSKEIFNSDIVGKTASGRVYVKQGDTFSVTVAHYNEETHSCYFEIKNMFSGDVVVGESSGKEIMYRMQGGNIAFVGKLEEEEVII